MWNEKGNSHLQQPILPSLFSIGAIGLTLAGALIWQSEFAYALDYVSSYVDGLLRWWYVALVAFLTAFVIWLGLGRYKNVRLGKDYEQPEYRLFPWLAMLFAAGTGVGLLFWSIAEPIMHFQGNPFTSEGFTPSAASTAIQLSFFHWGLNGWAIFALVAIAFGYFSYRHDLPLAPRSALYPFIGERIFGFWGHVVDALAVFATVFGLATTLGLGARQTGTGLKWLFSVE
ncbi:MAG: BCCT family transporter, partial [Marinobacter sp.]|nr:BCCT family transporter [Marinobacter sp.]